MKTVQSLREAIQAENKLFMLQNRKQKAATSILASSIRTVSNLEREIEAVDSALVEFYNSYSSPAGK
jgi:hypothetical protein